MTTPTSRSDPPSPPAAAPVRLGRAVAVAALLVAAALAAGLWPRGRPREARAAEAQALAVPTVTVVTPTPGRDPAGLALPAEVKAWIEAPIYARASGYLRRWRVDIGARVKRGELLAEIDTPELDRELERARQDLAEAAAALGLAKITAARYTELVKTASVSEQETAEKQADFALKTAREQGARANLRRLEELKGFARVSAPFAGTITARETDVGDLIVAGAARPLFRLAQVDRLRVYVRAPQPAAAAIAAGQTAELTVPELAGRVFAARVVRTAGALSPDSRTLLTELEVENPGGAILAGSYAQVRFKQAGRAAVLTLPGNSLLFRAEGPQVAVVGPDGTVTLRSVTLGRDHGKTVEILTGVTATDRVILNPPDALLGGTRVRVAAPGAEGTKR
jgi:RND family efflux transporter MFP subunit